MPFKQGHALIIGVGTHQYQPGLDVPITVTDAEAVANVLRDANACGYPPEQVQPLHKSAATKAGILSALDALAARAGAGDTVFLFYCGHGALGTDGNYYLISHDARLQGSRVATGTGVSEGELLQKLRNIKAQRMLMIFNACHSGNISPALGVGQEALEASNPGEDAAAALLGTGQGRIIIVACREQQVSYIGKGPLTIFTQALVDGLRGRGVHNSNGFISAFSLYEHVYESVSEAVQTNIGAAQEPELTVLRGVGPFAVSLYRGASSLGDFAGDEPLPAGMAVREVRPEKSARRFEQRVNTGGGDFVGRDKIVHGDEVHGDKVTGDKVGGDKITVGNRINITGDGNVIGQGSTSQVIKHTGSGDQIITTGPVATHGSAISTGNGAAVVGDGNTVITGKVSGEVQIVKGDEIQRDKVGGDKFEGNKYEIHLPSSPKNVRAASPLADFFEPSPPLKPEPIRLDVAAPRRAKVGAFSWLAVAVKQPDSLPLRIADLPDVVSEEGEIYRSSDQPIVKYRVEIIAPDFEIPEPSYVFLLEAGRDSKPRYFQLKPLRPGNLPILVSAYQIMEDEELAAQTRLSIEARLEAIE